MTEEQPQTGFLDVQGAPLYYEVAGTGHPLLLIHAGIADSRMWDDQFQAFAPNKDLGAPDQPGQMDKL